MNRLADSTSRGPRDYFHFGTVFLGIILAAGGIILTSPGFAMFGALVLAFGLAYFLFKN